MSFYLIISSLIVLFVFYPRNLLPPSVLFLLLKRLEHLLWINAIQNKFIIIIIIIIII